LRPQKSSPPGRPADYFVTYAGGRGRKTIEYRVDHPRWKLWPARAARFPANAARLKDTIASLYGQPFAAALSAPPVSAFYVDGSPVTVFRGRNISNEPDASPDLLPASP